MKIAVSSYSFQQAIRAGKMTQLDTVRAAAKMGFDGIEFIELAPMVDEKATWGQQMAYAEEIRKTAAECGIEIVAYTIGACLYKGDAQQDAEEVERLKKQVDVAEALGAKLMRHDICGSEKVGDRVVGFWNMLPTIAANVRQVTEYAQSKGIRTCSENHGYVAQDSDRVEALFNAVNHPNYGLLVDMGNFACADEPSVHAVSRLAPYAIHVHAKDFHILPFGTTPQEGVKSFQSRQCNLLCGCSVGEGDIPVRQCIAILKRAKYEGFFSIEYEGSEDCFKGIEKGLANLKSFLDEIYG